MAFQVIGANVLKKYIDGYNTDETIYPIYKKNSIVTVNFDISEPKTGVLKKMLIRTIGSNDLPEDDIKIDKFADYNFDVAIILDYNDDEKIYKVMLGTGEETFVEYGDIKSVIRYPFNNEYFGRNTKKVKQFIDDEWKSVDEKEIINDKEKYRKYQYNLLFQKIKAKLPSTYHYRLPQKNPVCKTQSTPNQKYSTNMIVVIKPYTWKSDVYDEVVAIILEYDYTEKDCKVLSFGSSIEDVIPKENIKTHIRCPEDGEYFGTAPNHSMKFNGEKNVWESVSEDEITKDRDIIINEKWKTCRDNIRAIQEKLLKKEEYEGGNRIKRKTHRKRIKQKTHRKRIKRKTHRK